MTPRAGIARRFDTDWGARNEQPVDEDNMKRLLTSLPVIITLATIGALALMFILVDPPPEDPAPDSAAVGLESVTSASPSARS